VAPRRAACHGEGMRGLVALAVIVIGVIGAGTASAKEKAKDAEDAWLEALAERVIADVAAGKPLVVQVHAPLCETDIIPCGNAKLGDGDNPATNLYWATTPGFGKWFARKGGGWKRVLDQQAADTGDADVLAVHVYRRSQVAPASWVARGAPKKFDVVVVVHGWRGSAIDRALAAYARELSGLDERALTLADGSTVTAGGAAQLVAYSGHNRLMDVDEFAWPAPGTAATGAIAVACKTADYMEETVPAPTRVPLLLTRDFLFANAAPVEAVVLTFASGGSYAAIRKAAAAAYAGVQGRETAKVFGAFTNPADRRWKHASVP
jgi:hypothetical protein